MTTKIPFHPIEIVLSSFLDPKNLDMSDKNVNF